MAKSLFGWFSSFFFCWLSQGLVVWLRLGDPFVSYYPREFCVSHFQGKILVYAYIICLLGQKSIFCTIPSRLPSPSSFVEFYTFFVLTYCICLLCDCFVYHHIIDICYLIAPCFDIVLLALFCTTVRRDSVSHLRFPFLSRVQFFLHEILLVCHLKCPYIVFWLFFFFC